MKFNVIKQKRFYLLLAIIGTLAGLSFYFISSPFNNQLQTLYQSQQSAIIKDRYGALLYIQPNNKGYYRRPLGTLPPRFSRLLLKKEDRFFYYHLGLNPVSLTRGAYYHLVAKKAKGSSTITQQLVKILLGNEKNRTVKNKLIESWYAVSLELHSSKKEILQMYVNTVYFGNQVQGLGEASWYYFNKTPETLNDLEILSLLAALSQPSDHYPGTGANAAKTANLAARFKISQEAIASQLPLGTTRPLERQRKPPTFFEIETLGLAGPAGRQLTLDQPLTEKLRQTLKDNLQQPTLASANNGAIVVIKLPETELLALIGSPNPYSVDPGQQINMALEPRPIGSTFKPFIYLQAFEKGARPYSLVIDREYKFAIGSGFPLYPKNYDGEYRGLVTLHRSLANSLNVPSVKVLEYAGLDDFYHWLRQDLQFKPIQPLDNYQLGIALGTLEMDLLTLSNYFTIFPNQGILKPLTLYQDAPYFLNPPMMEKTNQTSIIAPAEMIQLVNKILSDRETAVEQFGLKSDLNLYQKNYALKTGTSREFQDSWIIGFTPDFLVGIWIGNSDTAPMERLSGQNGAGKIWHEVMEVMFQTPYNKKTPFTFDRLQEFKNEDGSLEFGLPGDDYDQARHRLLPGQALILHPHNGDELLWESGMTVPLVAGNTVDWLVNDHLLGTGEKVSWQPRAAGQYLIIAKNPSGDEEVIRLVVGEE